MMTVVYLDSQNRVSGVGYRGADDDDDLGEDGEDDEDVCDGNEDD